MIEEEADLEKIEENLEEAIEQEEETMMVKISEVKGKMAAMVEIDKTEWLITLAVTKSNQNKNVVGKPIKMHLKTQVTDRLHSLWKVTMIDI